ncbi:3-dehydro-L-gulonate 2-dehydrogenase [Cloacibacillus evryensis]|nr:3-dehydro-L-gulonate 2-dehydrogenase [Cloacibacillus evryensis]MEA5035204.1 3-dehydro-L-gulonate 2-dehydrogenase [Cloacibacillus evryensis]
MKRVKYGEMFELFYSITTGLGFTESKAMTAAGIFTDNSCDGVYSHGLNRFPRFVSYIEKGVVAPCAEPAKEISFGAIERWNGNLGIGCTNAYQAMERAVALASEYGIGCVAMRNTNHWMRGGTYGIEAASKGFIGICWTNTAANMPAWGAKSCSVGNNPLVFAFPLKSAPMVIDGALAQYSYGALESAVMDGRKLPFPGGFDADGRLTDDPAAILATNRVLPIGFWKGSGYSLLLDVIGAALSGGLTVPDVARMGDEIALTQVFIAIAPEKTSSREAVDEMSNKLIREFKTAEPVEEGKPIYYPGEKAALTRKENIKNGIPVNETIWDEMLAKAASFPHAKNPTSALDMWMKMRIQSAK